MHDETLTLPIHKHLQLHASQYKQKTQHPSHPLHTHTSYFNTEDPRMTGLNSEIESQTTTAWDAVSNSSISYLSARNKIRQSFTL